MGYVTIFNYIYFFSQLRSVPYFGPSHTSVMFFAAIWLDHWATGDGSLCLDLRHVCKCMDGFCFLWEERIYGTRRFNAPAAGAQWKIYVYALL